MLSFKKGKSISPRQMSVKAKPRAKSKARTKTFGVVLLFLAFMIASFCADFWQTAEDNLLTLSQDISGKTDDVLKQSGCTLDKVFIRGLKHTDKQDVIRTLQLKNGMLLTKIDVNLLQSKIEAMPWIESAVVQRYFPDTIKIDVVEHAPIALWQEKGHYYVITAKGIVLGKGAGIYGLEDLPVIVGEEAPSKTPELLSLLMQNKELFARLKGATFVGKRRWDIFLDSLDKGLVIKLPENGVEAALQRLKKLQENYAILKRKLTLIDLRLPLKLIVRL